MEWILIVLTWYLYLFAVGIIFAPLAKKIFPLFYDWGYPFAKTTGIITASYTIYILGIARLIPFTRQSLFFVLIVYAFLLWKKTPWNKIKNWRKQPPERLLMITLEEVLFILSLFFLAFVRGQEPSIRGLEKFMDFGFMQSINRTQYFPPLDMWLSADSTKPFGYPINYYYFGHLSGALLTKLSGVSPYMGYNLVLATIFAQGITLVFSFVANIVYTFQKQIQKLKEVNILAMIIYGLLGSFIVNLAGNLHTIYIFTKGYPNDKPIPFWTIFQNVGDVFLTMHNSVPQKDFLAAMIENSKYWYPNATRFIPFTIHEFPSYSYVVADLHGHVYDIPFVLVTLAILFSIYQLHSVKRETIEATAEKKTHRPAWYQTITEHISKLYHRTQKLSFFSSYHQYKNPPTLFNVLMTVLLGFLIAVHYMTNAFDGPIYILLTVCVFFAMYQLSLHFFIHTLLVGITFYIFSKPFSYFFSPFVSGVGVNCSPKFLTDGFVWGPLSFAGGKLGPFLFEKGNCQVSELYMLGVLWGFFWLCALILLFIVSTQSKKSNKNTISVNSFDVIALIFFVYGTFLIFVPEFFYIKDIYPSHFRANTMFKMGYQAFMMMGIMSAYVMYRIRTVPFYSKYILKVIYGLFFALIFLYPFFAFPSYYPGLNDVETYYAAVGIHSAKNPESYRKPPELDGSTWLTTQFPEDKEIIEYFNTHVNGQPVILESQGDSYTDHERISAYTGLPTVAGWWVHEWLWRGSPEVVGQRIPDITNMYESEDINLTTSLLKKYNVSYVIVSGLEKSKYPNLKESKFSTVGTKIFETSNRVGAIYQIN